MRITIEIKNLKDWEILLPLLKRLKIKVLDKTAITKQEHANTATAQKHIENEGIMQFAGILSDEEATVFEAAIIESRKIDLNEW